MGRKVIDKPRDIILQLRINENEKEKLNIISKTLDLSYREVFTLALNVIGLTIEKLPKNAVFRFRSEGDEIHLFGGGTKTLKKLFNEKKIPVKEREYLPLIASGDSHDVYVVCGVEISEEIKVTNATQQILYIKLQKKKESKNANKD